MRVYEAIAPENVGGLRLEQYVRQAFPLLPSLFWNRLLKRHR